MTIHTYIHIALQNGRFFFVSQNIMITAVVLMDQFFPPLIHIVPYTSVLYKVEGTRYICRFRICSLLSHHLKRFFVFFLQTRGCSEGLVSC